MINALDVPIYPHYIQGMRDQPISFRVSAQFKSDLDMLRKAEPDLPSQTEMLHRLVERAKKKALRNVNSAKALADRTGG